MFLGFTLRYYAPNNLKLIDREISININPSINLRYIYKRNEVMNPV